MKRILFLTILLISIKSGHCYNWNFGTYVPGFMSYQDDSSGGTKKFEINPFTSISFPMPAPLLDGYFFVPEFGLTLHLFDQKDDVKKYTFMFMYPLAFKSSESLLWRFGFATFVDRITGDGSQKNYNGTSYTPEKAQTTYTSAILLGSELIASATYSLRLDLFINRFLSSERRNFSYVLGMNFFFN